MATTYSQMVDKVLAWSNRDIEVLPYATIKDFINYAVDDAYRMLRVPPQEHVVTYTVNEANAGTNEIIIPPDLIEVIQLRRQTGRSDIPYDIYDAKSDIRSFYDPYETKYTRYHFTRQENRFLVSPDFVEGDKIELYYYRRLPEIDARYSIGGTLSNLRYTGTSKAAVMQVVIDSEGTDVFIKDPELESRIMMHGDSDWRVGKLVDNWLRDENEKIVLFGALGQAFDYLNEPENAQKYMARFKEGDRRTE